MSRAHAAVAGRAGPGQGEAGVARFCHLIHIITGVSLLYGGGELIAPVTVSSCLRLLGSSAGFLPPRRRHKSEVLRQFNSSASLLRDHISAALWLSPSCTSARTEQLESRCLWNPRPPANLAHGVWRLDF